MQRSVVSASHTRASANLGSVNVLWITAYTHSQRFCIDSAGFDRQCMSCVRTSAFLHVFYVLYMFVIFSCRSFVCMHICVCVFASIRSMYVVWVCLFMFMFIVQNNDVFSIWGMGSEKVILWDTVCCCALDPFELKLYNNTAFVNESTLTKILQSITLRGYVRKCYILLLTV